MPVEPPAEAPLIGVPHTTRRPYELQVPEGSAERVSGEANKASRSSGWMVAACSGAPRARKAPPTERRDGKRSRGPPGSRRRWPRSSRRAHAQHLLPARSGLRRVTAPALTCRRGCRRPRADRSHVAPGESPLAGAGALVAVLPEPSPPPRAIAASDTAPAAANANRRPREATSAS